MKKHSETASSPFSLINKPYGLDFVQYHALYGGDSRLLFTPEEEISGASLVVQGDGAPPTIGKKKYLFLARNREVRREDITLYKRGEKFSIFCIESKKTGEDLLQDIGSARLEIVKAGKIYKRLGLHLWGLEVDGIWQETEVPDSFLFYIEKDAEKTPQILLQAAVAYERRLNVFDGISESYRLVHRGELDIPASIDIYGEYLLVSAYSDTENAKDMYHKLLPALQYLREKTAWKGGLIRKHALNPHVKKLVNDTYAFGEELPESSIVREHGLDYQVNINDSQHVGLFLDMRDMRRRVIVVARDKRIANLFSFTCSFSLAAVSAGAEVVFSVDLAGSTLNRGKENFKLNGLDEGGRGKFVQEDVMVWLAKQEKRLERDGEDYKKFDLIICDPPVFASAGKGKSFHVEKQWPTMARQIAKLLNPGGIALMANNHRAGDERYYKNELKKHFKGVQQFLPAPDFPELEDAPSHVRIYWCEV